MAGKVIRCECGVLFDTDEHAACPSCGAPPRAEQAPSASGSRAPSQPSPASTPARRQRPWLLYAGAAAVVVLVAALAIRLLLDSGEGSGSAETEGDRGGPAIVVQEDPGDGQTETPRVDETGADEQTQSVSRQDQQDSQQTALPPSPGPQPAPPAGTLVDPVLVGAWSLDFPGTQGIQHWVMEIRADGSYAFTSEGGGPTIRHVGSFRALHGAWSLKSTTINWEDGGTYQLPDPNTFHLLGKLGLGIWRRSG